MEILHKTYLGQHFLVSKEILEYLSNSIPKNNIVAEIGAGDGRLTELLAKNAKRVIAVEIDKDRFGDLRKMEQKNRNLKVIFADFLTLNYGNLGNPRYLIGSLPYHIIEPLFMKIFNWPIKKAVFTLGARFYTELKADYQDSNFGKLNLLINTFYNWKVLKELPKDTFYPQPPTPAFIIEFTPMSKKEFLNNLNLFLFRELFYSSAKGTKVKNVLKEGLINYYRRQDLILSQNEAKNKIVSGNLRETLLEKSFEQLNNQELGELASRLTSIKISSS